MDDIAVDDGVALQPDPGGPDRARDAAPAGHFLGNHVAFDRAAIADQDAGGAQRADDPPEHPHLPGTLDASGDRHIGADARDRRGLWCGGVHGVSLEARRRDRRMVRVQTITAFNATNHRHRIGGGDHVTDARRAPFIPADAGNPGFAQMNRLWIWQRLDPRVRGDERRMAQLREHRAAPKGNFPRVFD